MTDPLLARKIASHLHHVAIHNCVVFVEAGKFEVPSNNVKFFITEDVGGRRYAPIRSAFSHAAYLLQHGIIPASDLIDALSMTEEEQRGWIICETNDAVACDFMLLAMCGILPVTRASLYRAASPGHVPSPLEVSLNWSPLTQSGTTSPPTPSSITSLASLGTRCATAVSSMASKAEAVHMHNPLLALETVARRLFSPSTASDESMIVQPHFQTGQGMEVSMNGYYAGGVPPEGRMAHGPVGGTVQVVLEPCEWPWEEAFDEFCLSMDRPKVLELARDWALRQHEVTPMFITHDRALCMCEGYILATKNAMREHNIHPLRRD
jgi:hypothetical protein